MSKLTPNPDQSTDPVGTPVFLDVHYAQIQQCLCDLGFTVRTDGIWDHATQQVYAQYADSESMGRPPYNEQPTTPDMLPPKLYELFMGEPSEAALARIEEVRKANEAAAAAQAGDVIQPEDNAVDEEDDSDPDAGKGQQNGDDNTNLNPVVPNQEKPENQQSSGSDAKPEGGATGDQTGNADKPEGQDEEDGADDTKDGEGKPAPRLNEDGTPMTKKQRKAADKAAAEALAAGTNGTSAAQGNGGERILKV